jgi:centrosomal protein CEP104
VSKVGFLKLVVHRCHVNHLNAYNQVGIIAINCLGNSNKIDGLVMTDNYHKQTHHAPGAGGPKKIGGEGKTFQENGVGRRLKALDSIKLSYAREEDFDSASDIKNCIVNVTGLAEACDDLEERMKRAARDEDYAEAGRLKKQKEACKLNMLEALEDAERNYGGKGGGGGWEYEAR